MKTIVGYDKTEAAKRTLARAAGLCVPRRAAHRRRVQRQRLGTASGSLRRADRPLTDAAPAERAVRRGISLTVEHSASSARAVGWNTPLTMAREPAAAVRAGIGLPHPAASPEHPDPRHELAGPDPPQPSPCWR